MAGEPGKIDYRQDRQQLIYDLICRDNPEFKSVAKFDDFTLSGLAVQVADEFGRDTTATIVPTPSSGLVGTTAIQYRRLDAAAMFRGRTLTITEWSAGSSITRAEYLTLFEKYFGIKFHPDDVSLPSTFSYGGNVTLQFPATSWCWKPGNPNITLRLVKGKQPLSSITGGKVMRGRNWPQAMIDVQDANLPQGELLVYNGDFSANASTWQSYPFGAFDNGSQVNPAVNLSVLVTELKKVRPDIAWSRNDPRISVGGIGYLTVSRYSLPHPDVPEADAAKYNFVMVLKPAWVDTPPTKNWFYGNLIVHYGLRV